MDGLHTSQGCRWELRYNPIVCNYSHAFIHQLYMGRQRSKQPIRILSEWIPRLPYRGLCSRIQRLAYVGHQRWRGGAVTDYRWTRDHCPRRDQLSTELVLGIA